jgi:hypothetical protein
VTIDDSAHNDLVCGDTRGQVPLHEVYPHRLDGRRQQNRKSIIERTVRSRNKEARPNGRRPQSVIGALSSGENEPTIDLDTLTDQRRLVELNPFSADRSEGGKEFRIDRKQIIQSIKRLVAIGRTATGL